VPSTPSYRDPDISPIPDISPRASILIYHYYTAHLSLISFNMGLRAGLEPTHSVTFRRADSTTRAYFTIHVKEHWEPHLPLPNPQRHSSLCPVLIQ